MCERGTGIPKIFFFASSSSQKRRKRTKSLKLPERGTLAFDFRVFPHISKTIGALMTMTIPC